MNSGYGVLCISSVELFGDEGQPESELTGNTICVNESQVYARIYIYVDDRYRIQFD